MSFETAYVFGAIITSTAALLILAGTSKFVLSRQSIQPTIIHRFSYFVILMAALSPLAYLSAPEQSFTVVSGQTFDDPKQIRLAHPHATHYKSEVIPLSHDSHTYQKMGVIALCLMFLWFVGRYFADCLKISRILSSSIELRSIGRVRVLVNGSTDVPFAYRTFRTAYVVVPESIVIDPCNFKMAVKHELQHHRQGDTIWSHFAYFTKSLFFWNPLVHLAHKRISEVQELACDEALIGRRGVNAHQYCHCLLAVAEHAMSPQRLLVGTAGMSMGVSAQQLKWRVEMMSRYGVKSKFKVFAIMGSITVATIASVALASSGVVYDQKVTLVEARELLKNFDQSEFPIEVNEQIVAQLNYYIGTPRGRDWVKAAMGRKIQYDAIIQQKLNEYSAPADLIAIALIESGFKNHYVEPSRITGAGIWMFIPQTARRYGLRVDKVTDERLDVLKETDAAMRLMSDLYDRFGDWRLALIGYNAGGNMVQRGIDETGERDPWKLIEAGYENEPDYLAKIMAGALILKNPDLIR